MNVGRASYAHIVSVFLASGILLANIGFLEAGPKGWIDRLFNWLGGFLIFGFLALVSLPVGLLLRWFGSSIGLSAPVAAMSIGLAVSLALIPILHPALLPGLELEAQGLKLMVAHGVAGLFGGMIWMAIEHPSSEAN